MFLRSLIAEYSKAGHEVCWLDPNQTGAQHSGMTTVAHAHECDVTIIMWRWSMPTYPERHAAYLRQWVLLEECAAHHIPCIIHNQDLKITDGERCWLDQWPNFLVTVPALAPAPGDCILHYPYYYSRDVQRQLWPFRSGCIYVGNNYERYAQAKTYINPVAEVVDVDVYGNWLNVNKSRELPEQVKSDFQRVLFHEPIEHREVLQTLINARMTIHLAKPEYNECGFMALRWAEAAAAGVAAIIPAEFYGWRGALGQVRSSSPNDIYYMAKHLDDCYINELVWQAQREFVLDTMRFEPWHTVLKEVTNG